MCSNIVATNYPFHVNTGVQLRFFMNTYVEFIDCRITLTFDGRMVGLLWRSFEFTSHPQKLPDCDRAFFEVSIQNTKPYKMCKENLQAMPPFQQIAEFPNVPVTLRLFVNLSTSETPTTFLPTTDIASTTDTPNWSTEVYSVTPTTEVPFYMVVLLEFTTFSYCATLDSQSFMCYQSRRCISKSLICDDLQNCVTRNFNGDFSDEYQCQGNPPPGPVSLMPLWVTLGILAGCLVAYWCLYRPGYLPWRLARIRNARCCGRYLCARCCCKTREPGGCSNCFGSRGRSVSPNMKQDTPGSSVKCANVQPGNVQTLNNGDSGLNYQQTAVTPVSWMSIKYDDGNHLRELR